MRKRNLFRAFLISEALLLFPPAAPTVAAPVSGSEDPLLEEPWIDMESDRAEGISNAIREDAGSQRPFSLEDLHNRKFLLNLSGDMAFSPAMGNWAAVVPSTEDAEKHLAEADALYRLGEKEKAVALWKALAAMGASSRAPGHLRRTAAEASARLNRLAQRGDFPGLHAATDPFVYFDGIVGRTIVRSDLQGWQMELPGSWRFRRDTRRRRSDGGLYSVVYVKHGKVLMAVASEALRITALPENIGGYVSLWDTRRGITEALKKQNGFFRKRDPALDLLCKELVLEATNHGQRERASGGDNPEGALAPSGFLAESGGGDGAVQQREFYFLRPNAGFFFIIGPVPLDENIFTFIVKHLTFHKP